MSKTIEIRVPDIGDFVKVPVIEILAQPGDTIEAEESLITLESDKATMEVPAPHTGTLVELTVKEGDELSEGDVIGSMEIGEGANEDNDEASVAGDSTDAKPTPESAPTPPSNSATATALRAAGSFVRAVRMSSVIAPRTPESVSSAMRAAGGERGRPVGQPVNGETGRSPPAGQRRRGSRPRTSRGVPNSGNDDIKTVDGAYRSPSRCRFAPTGRSRPLSGDRPAGARVAVNRGLT